MYARSTNESEEEARKTMRMTSLAARLYSLLTIANKRWNGLFLVEIDRW